MDQPAPVINPDHTQEQREQEMRRAAATYLRGDPAWREAVVQLALEHRTSLLHAHYLYQVANPPATTCSFCGQPSDLRHRLSDWAMTPDHALCEARQRSGRPIVPLPWAPECHCSPCSAQAAAELAQRTRAAVARHKASQAAQ